MRFYHRVGQLTYKRLFSHHDRAFLRWVLSLKPGDIIGACTGLNHVVAEILPIRQSWRNGWFLSEVRVTDDQGQWHWAPGGGCVCQPYTREDVLKFAAECASSNDLTWSTPEGRAWWQAMLDAEARGEPTIDPRGVYTGPPRPIQPAQDPTCRLILDTQEQLHT